MGRVAEKKNPRCPAGGASPFGGERGGGKNTRGWSEKSGNHLRGHRGGSTTLSYLNVGRGEERKKLLQGGPRLKGEKGGGKREETSSRLAKEGILAVVAKPQGEGKGRGRSESPYRRKKKKKKRGRSDAA